MLVKQGWLVGLMLSGFVWFAGCSNSAAPERATAETDQPAAEPSEESVPPPASIAGKNAAAEDDDDEDEPDADDDVATVEPAEGTAEWHVREIVRLRLKPIPALESAESEKAEEEISPEEAQAKAAKELEHQAEVRRERNLEVINLAKQAIALTIKDPAKEMVFSVAAHHLLDARLQLALGGEQQDVDALYEIAEALQQSRPHTEIAAAARLTIVNFAHANAVRYAEAEPKWIQEFARQAQTFAKLMAESQDALTEEEKKTPNNRRVIQVENDVSRAAQILLAAGQSCETANLGDDAKACYQLLKAKFPETLPAQQAAGIIRRLNLRGQPLELAGPTLDGKFLSIDDLKGKTVLVVFWSSQAKPFVDQLSALTEFLKVAQEKGVAVVSVNLDMDELEVADFMEGRGLTWPTIFHSEPEKRGWNAPAASYYGIMNLPTFWIVDANGVVAETDVTAESVKTKLVQVFRKDQQRAKSGEKNTIRQTNSSGESPQ